MPRYALKRKGEAVREEEEEKTEGETAEEMKSVLEEKMQEAWAKPEAREMKRKISKVAKTHWKPQIEETLRVTKYGEELKARAREIEYDKKMKKVWK